MKKSYETPEISVVLFENEDIVTSSGGLLSGVDENGYSFTDNIFNFDSFNE